MSIYSDNNLLMLSGIQHVAFCERQYALIHIENMWMENELTIQGHRLHERVDDPFESNNRNGLICLTSVSLVSYELGLYGKADLIELERTESLGSTVKIEGWQGHWRVKPVEYKRGKPKPGVCDKVQLCAQVMCLEEMFGIHIDSAEIFYGEPRRRFPVEMGANLRQLTKQYAQKMHQIHDKGETPKPIYKKHCHSCSLYSICKPLQFSNQYSATEYINKMINIEE